MWRESLIFERDGSWMRFGLPTKKVQRSDLGSSWFIDSTVFFFFFPTRATELELKIVCSQSVCSLRISVHRDCENG